MLDIKLIRENPELVKAGVARKGNDADIIDHVLELDGKVRSLKTDGEALRAEQKNESKNFGKIKKEGGDVAALKAKLDEMKEQISEKEQQLTDCLAEMEELMDHVPNLPHNDVPDGKDENDNKVEKTVGDLPKLAHAKPHWEFAGNFGFEAERGARISGSGFMLNVGPLAKLERALISFFLDRHTSKNGYTEVAAPFMVRRDPLYGTGYLPKMEGEQYHAERDDLFLIPTAEVPLTAIHADEILAEEDLPKQYCAFTPCWRRESGAAGADTRGMVRVHQFNKVEMMRVVHPDQSYQAHEELTRNAEELLEDLGLAYRRLLLCAGDMSFAAAKCYDLEVFSAGVDRWLEVSSCSNFESFQARRSKIRYKSNETKKNEFCHTLNGSGLALPRIMVALLENNLQEDGSVKLPECLHSYYGGETL